MDEARPSQSTITCVAEALLTTLDVEQAVAVMLAQFDWDAVFVALSELEDPLACRAMWLALEQQTAG